jgi:cell wall assembly regulator SMI1
MAIRQEMRKQLSRLEKCFSLLDLPMTRRPGATNNEIESVEKATGIVLDESLKAMWSYSNGSGSQAWFVCDAEETREMIRENEEVFGKEEDRDAESFAGSVFNFYSIDQLIESWSIFKDIDEKNPNGWAVDSSDSFAPQDLDKRIGPQMLRHKQRLPFGTLFMSSDEILIDACPSKLGSYGQIVKYRHDPDSLTFVTSSFASFLDRSLYWMERLIPKNPDKMRGLHCDPQTDLDLWLESHT